MPLLTPVKKEVISAIIMNFGKNFCSLEIVNQQVLSVRISYDEQDTFVFCSVFVLNPVWHEKKTKNSTKTQL